MHRITFLSLGMLVFSASVAPRLTSQTPVATPAGSAQTSPATPAVVVSGRADLAAPLDKVWDALPAAYASLSIPITVNEPANRTIGAERMRTHHYLGDARLSKLLDCGESAGGLNADTYEVNLSVLTQLQSNAAGGTTVATRVDAVAKPASTAGQYSSCVSTGQLETRLVRFIESQLK
jgi:hypothetical protein